MEQEKTPFVQGIIPEGGFSQTEIAEIFCVSRQRIQQIEAEAMVKLRDAINASGLNLDDMFDEQKDVVGRLPCC